MNDVRVRAKTDSPGRLRAQRRAAALVAQYIHELSERHARARQQIPAVVAHSLTSTGAVHTSDCRGG